MRRLLLIAPFLLTACNKEPDFDERYDKAAQEVEARAKAMDADIAASEAAAKATGEKAGKDLPEQAAPANAPKSSGE